MNLFVEISTLFFTKNNLNTYSFDPSSLSIYSDCSNFSLSSIFYTTHFAIDDNIFNAIKKIGISHFERISEDYIDSNSFSLLFNNYLLKFQNGNPVLKQILSSTPSRIVYRLLSPDEIETQISTIIPKSYAHLDNMRYYLNIPNHCVYVDVVWVWSLEKFVAFGGVKTQNISSLRNYFIQNNINLMNCVSKLVLSLKENYSEEMKKLIEINVIQKTSYYAKLFSYQNDIFEDIAPRKPLPDDLWKGMQEENERFLEYEKSLMLQEQVDEQLL